MTSSPLIAWGPAESESYGRIPTCFAHRLLERLPFDDDLLADLLERHPEALTDVNVFDYDARGQSKIRSGRRGALNGAEMLERVKAGRVWVNLRSIERANDHVGRLIRDVMHTLLTAMSRERPIRWAGHLLLSGPKARVPYHLDVPMVALFHLRGRKRIRIYPAAAPYVDDRSFERIVMRSTSEDLPYAAEFEHAAMPFDLDPGMAVTWPLNAPHRVDNLGDFNVSLSLEFMTWEARLKAGAAFCNGQLRERFGMRPPALASISAPGRAARFALGAALRRMGAAQAQRMRFPVEFDLAQGGRV